MELIHWLIQGVRTRLAIPKLSVKSNAFEEVLSHPPALSLDPDDPSVTHIKPSHGWMPLQLRELWAARELLYFFVWRDVKVRYKQTVLGAAWAILQPLSTMVIFSLIFGVLAGIPSDGISYPAFAFAALVPWTYFANALSHCASCLVSNQQLVKKVYFPRLAIPIAAVLSGLVDFAFAFVVLLGIMAFYGIAPTIQIIWLPFLLLLAVVTALAVGLWLSALNARYRDVQYVVSFLVQLWLFATPVAYPSSLLPEEWRTVYALNPMVGVVEGFRWALLSTDTAPGPALLVSSLTAFALLIGGAQYFRRMEKNLDDVI